MVITREVREEIESAVNQAVSKSINSDTFIKTLTNNVTTAIIKTIDKKLSLLEESVADLRNTMKEDKLELENKIKFLEKSLKDEEIENNKMKNIIDKIDQASRSTCLRMFNVPEKSKEDTREEVIKLIKTKMNLNILPADIQICYRIGNKNNTKARGIYLKLNKNETKQNIYSKKKLLKGSNVVIKEDLTSTRLELLNEATSKYGLKHTWTHNGKIYANVNDKILLIRCKKDLEDTV
ncbi:unnamed protein product [Phaedon cochleariae]|uniref:Uncharacterized protein n=1 Tax=Phaedon cochleariae TaxID=80249 RepID=A0A9P0GSU5_PHACE|nr:unnamed protein product [Phaedon cochleariae]